MRLGLRPTNQGVVGSNPAGRASQSLTAADQAACFFVPRFCPMSLARMRVSTGALSPYCGNHFS